MTGIDTNILLRYVLGDEPEQTARVRRFVDEECGPDRRARINVVVVAELMWFVCRRLKASRDEAAAMLASLIDNAHLAFDAEEELVAALDAFSTGVAEFNDYLVAYLNVAAGHSPTLTFDRKAARDPAFSLLS